MPDVAGAGDFNPAGRDATRREARQKPPTVRVDWFEHSAVGDAECAGNPMQASGSDDSDHSTSQLEDRSTSQGRHGIRRHRSTHLIIFDR